MKKIILLVALVLVMVSCGGKNSFMGGSPIIISFSSSSYSLSSLLGETAILSWDVNDATTVRITSVGDVPLKGSLTVFPRVTTTYNLSASNKNALVQQSLTVVVK